MGDSVTAQQEIVGYCETNNVDNLKQSLNEWSNTQSIDQLSKEQRSVIIQYAIEHVFVPSNQSIKVAQQSIDPIIETRWDCQSLTQFICLLKIISRQRTGLDALYHHQAISWLIDHAVHFNYQLLTQSDASDHAELHSRSNVSLEATRLLLNLTIIQADKTRAIFAFDQALVTSLIAAVQLLASINNTIIQSTGLIDQSIEHVFLILRILLFLTVDASIAEHSRSINCFESLSQVFIDLSDPIDMLTDQVDPTINNRSGLRRRALAELIKLVTHLAMDQQSINQIEALVSTETAIKFAEKMTLILALNAQLTEDVCQVLADPEHPDDPTNPRPLTKIALHEIAQINQPTNQTVSLLDLKSHIADCLIYLPVKMIHFIASHHFDQSINQSINQAAIQSLITVLHVRLLQSINQRANEVENLCPILQCLIRVISNSQSINQLIKIIIFVEYANAAPVGESINQRSMLPAGAVSEREFDVDPKSVKALLIPYLTSIKVQLKQLVGEFIWHLSNEDGSEVVRLVGFGNAAGLLAEKGMPGMTGIQTLSL